MSLSTNIENSQSSKSVLKAVELMNYYLNQKDATLSVTLSGGREYTILNSKDESVDSLQNLFETITAVLSNILP